MMKATNVTTILTKRNARFRDPGSSQSFQTSNRGSNEPIANIAIVIHALRGMQVGVYHRTRPDMIDTVLDSGALTVDVWKVY